MPTIKDKKTGDVVSRQPYTAEGTQRAETIVQANPDWEIDYAPGGTENAPDKRESYQLGGQVPGQPGFGQRPSPIPNPYSYKEGGEVEEKSFAEKEAERLPRWTAAGKAAADVGKALIGVPGKWKEMTDEAKKFYKKKFDEYKKSGKKKKKKQTYNI